MLGVMAGLIAGLLPDVTRPGVSAGDSPALKFWEKFEFKLCVMPEIIILVCSEVSVRPLL